MDDLIEDQNEGLEFLQRFIDNHNKTADNKITTGYIQARSKLLDDNWVIFKSKHDTIKKGVKREDRKKVPYFTEDTFSKFQEDFLDIKGTLHDLLIKLQTNPQPGNQANQQLHNLQNQGDVKLPKVNIPEFSGNYEDWTNFHDLFTSLIHNNAKLTNVQKMHYLKTALKGDAVHLLKHFSITEANYTPAWAMLIARYKNSRLIINSHLKTLVSQPKLLKESAVGLRLLLDTTTECLQALKNLEVPTEHWDAIVVFLVEQRMDSDSFKSWEQTREKPEEVPTFAKLSIFLQSRFRTLEIVSESNEKATPNKPQQKNVQSFHTSQKGCFVCSGPHRMHQCPQFLKMTTDSRRHFVESRSLCFNCLGIDHQVNSCPSKFTCRSCQKKHHSLLHKNTPASVKQSPCTLNSYGQSSRPKTTSTPNATEIESSPIVLHTIQPHLTCSREIVVLATALVKVETASGNTTLRALIDQGSQASFISEDAVQRLQLKKSKLFTSVTGLDANSTGTSTSCVSFNMQSHHDSNFELMVTAHVMPSITQLLPSQHLPQRNWTHLRRIKLADPEFAVPGKIDILLGADVFCEIIMKGLRRGKPNEPVAQKTMLGWIISGKTINSGNQYHTTVQSFHNCVEVENLIKRFWEIEELSPEKHLSVEERICEDIYKSTHTREPDGRYKVSLPFIDSTQLKLGISRSNAVNTQLQMEKRFEKNPQLAEDYSAVMSDYINNKHMELIEISEDDPANSCGNQYYLPHHGVIKEESTSTKLRVVFDASRKSSSGVSLNDKLIVGPTIQQDLLSIMIRWRKHQIAFTADIEKMYRQVRISDSDTDYQRIVWRSSPLMPLQDYRLQTVTFGVSSAPFLAIRTLQQLAIDESTKYPEAAEITLRDFYVDDLMSGCNTIHEATIAQNQLMKLLQSGGFELKKWASNSETLITNIPATHRRNIQAFDINFDDVIKTLGIRWHPQQDVFRFKVNLSPSNNLLPTKRILLSDVAKLFDPLGWLAPSIIIAKIMFQKLWLLGLSWDDILPTDISKEWFHFRDNLQQIEQIRIPRWIKYEPSNQIQLHGFCDASSLAYGAVIYSRILTSAGYETDIVISKTRVAPIKTISVPRLELCGAVLLAKLFHIVKKALTIDEISCFAWTDSTVVLAWLHKPPSHWKVFVANRVTEVLEVTPSNQWRHVPSEDNPADCASRGIAPEELYKNQLWWNGPAWLKEHQESWPILKNASSLKTDMEVRKSTVITTLTTTIPDLLNNFSTKIKTVRVFGYIRRFIFNSRAKNQQARLAGHLTVSELQDSLHTIILLVQQSTFSLDMKNLANNKDVNKKSKLSQLNPFLDSFGLLRVGGRLQKSNLSFNEIHPLILPHNHHFTTLLIREAHDLTLHGGAQMTVAYLRRKYWIINARNTVRNIIHRCVKCHKYATETRQQLMGSLPTPRINPSRPFTHTGLDYAGPIQVRSSKGRGIKSFKGYLAIFVCLATKAIHIELVSDMTTDTFIAALRRFTARRGLCSDIYSDCGSNFIGAQNVLKSDFVKSVREAQEGVDVLIAKDGINWHFIPPASPNFGGLWEAGVKSIKYHLKRIIGDSKLTFEELTTVLNQIEACLNSRPLVSTSSDPTDLTALTPAHFMIGGALTTPPEPSLVNAYIPPLKRWKLVQKMYQNFWSIWSTEYLSRLQQRPKWLQSSRNLQINEMVIIKDNRLPPSKWLLGRILEVHPGDDGYVRVVTVKCSNGSTMKRPVSKISPLPIIDNEEVSTNQQ